MMGYYTGCLGRKANFVAQTKGFLRFVFLIVGLVGQRLAFPLATV
jgi:hypothetical protein